MKALGADQLEARDIHFEILDEWYAVQEITQDVCVVYGTIWVREKMVPGRSVFVEMDSRFTVVCKKTPLGVQLCHLHHSIPYMEQRDGEYYPRTLADLAQEALQKSAVLERRVELDGLTELYNRIYTERHISQATLREAGIFFMLDLDGFKNLNDTLGHLKGDEVIQKFALLMRDTFGSGSLLGRMGGDEFAVWVPCADPQAAKAYFTKLQQGCSCLSRQLGVPFGCCAGLAVSVPPGEVFEALYLRADQALYRAKAKGIGCFEWAK